MLTDFMPLIIWFIQPNILTSSSQEHFCPTQNISSYLPAIPGCLLNWRDFKSMSMSVSCLLNWYQFENLTFKVNVLSLTRFWLHLKSLTLPVKHLDDQFHFFHLVFTPPKSQTQINLELSDLSTKWYCCDFTVIHLEESWINLRVGSRQKKWQERDFALFRPSKDCHLLSHIIMLASSLSWLSSLRLWGQETVYTDSSS